MKLGEKDVLKQFESREKADTLTISREVGLSIESTRDILKKLVDKGKLEEINSGSWERWHVYRVKKREEYDLEVHTFWHELISYVKEHGGHLKLNIRFKDGIPIEADDIKKKVRFDLNARQKNKE